MKYKLIQVLLGAIGSALTVLISHYANAPADVAMITALSAGPTITALAGDAVANIVG